MLLADAAPTAVSMFEIFPPAIVRRSAVHDKPLTQFPFMQDDTSTWEKQAVLRLLAEIAGLPDDWDGEGAPAIPAHTIHVAEAFVAGLRGVHMPTLLPHPRGTVTIEWESERGSACLEIGRDRFSFYARPKDGVPSLLDGESGDLSKRTEFVAALVGGIVYPVKPMASARVALHEGVGQHDERYPA